MPAASSIYWNSEDSQRSSVDSSEPNSSSSSSGAADQRRYVDPWDLENYAYLRRRQQFVAATASSRNDHHQQPNSSSPLSNESSYNDSYYWYPGMPVSSRDSGYNDNHPAIAVDDQLYLRQSRQIHHQTVINQQPVQIQASYDDDARYVTPNPIYVPLSDLENSEEATEHPHELIKLLPRRRNRPIKNMAHHKEECPCPYHGTLLEIAVTKDPRITPPKQLGLNTYGHLRIDYAKSWNSLHRKMKK